MTDNQHCYVCGTLCWPGKGLTDDKGRRHIECPSTERLAKMRESAARLNRTRSAGRRTQGTEVPR